MTDIGLEKIARELNDEVLKAYMLPPRDAQLEPDDRSWSLLVTQVDELIRLSHIAAIRAWERRDKL
jgi:hypothetical protein